MRPELQRSPTRVIGGSCSDRRRRGGAVGPGAHLLPPGLTGPALDGSQEKVAPRTRACAARAYSAGGCGRGRVERALPASAFPSGPGPLNRQPHASADGHRFPALTATSTAGAAGRFSASGPAAARLSPPARRRTKAPPTDRRGTRQWRPGRE